MTGKKEFSVGGAGGGGAGHCGFSACHQRLAAKEIHALRAEQSAKGETKEDGVTIMGQYTIRSTLPISDAYRSGNTSGLDSKEKETLDMGLRRAGGDHHRRHDPL